MPVRYLGSGVPNVSAEDRDWRDLLVDEFNNLERVVLGEEDEVDPSQLPVEVREQRAGEQFLQQGALQGIYGEAERLQALFDTEQARRVSLEDRVVELESQVRALQARPVVAAPVTPPVTPPPAAGVPILCATIPLTYLWPNDRRTYPTGRGATAGLPSWDLASTAPAAFRIGGVGGGSLGFSQYLHVEPPLTDWSTVLLELVGNDGMTVDDTDRVAMGRHTTETLTTTYTNGTATVITVNFRVEMTVGRGGIGSQLRQSYVMTFTTDANDGVALVSGHTYPSTFRVSLIR